MKNIKYIVVFILVAIVTLSCKKDDVEEILTDDYTVTVDGDELKDGDIWETSSSGSDGNMVLLLSNTSSNQINFKMKIISIDGVIIGQDISFCIGDCYTSENLIEGGVYPIQEAVYSLQTEGNSGGLVHIENSDVRNESYSLVVKLYQTDDNGVELTSKKSVQFTYKYVKN